MNIFSKLHVLAKRYMKLSKEELEQINLTMVQANVLSILANNKEEMIQREIGEKAFLKAGSMSRMIDTLEEKGLVFREQDPESRRSYKINLTNEGVRVNELSKKIFKDVENKLFSHLTDEEKVLFLRLIEKITYEENKDV